MSVDVLVLLVTAALAVVALAAAVVAVRALREVRQLRSQPVPDPATAQMLAAQGPAVAAQQYREHDPVEAVEGRVIVPVSQEQLVAAELSRPSVRAAVVWAGVSHALRPESRRRIAILVRREYRLRRRARLRAGRRAARTTHQSGQSERWLSS